MSRCPGAVAGPDGLCVHCGRPVATYRGVSQHRRGRHAIERCECGQPADPRLHSPLPKIDMRSWQSKRALREGVGWDGQPDRASVALGGAASAA